MHYQKHYAHWLWGISCIVLLLSGCVLKPRVVRQDGLKQADRATRAKAHAKLAAAYMDINRYDIANEEAKIAIKIDALSGPANNISGLIALRLEKYDQAKHYFRQALQSESNNPNFQNNMAFVLCKTGQIDHGLDLLYMALANKLYTSPQNSLMNAGFCMMQREDWHQAESYYQQAKTFNQTALQALEQLTVIYLKTDRVNEAKTSINEVMVLAGTPTAKQLKLGIIAAKRSGDFDEAKSIRKRLHIDYPNLATTPLLGFTEESFDQGNHEIDASPSTQASPNVQLQRPYASQATESQVYIQEPYIARYPKQ